MAKMGRPLKFKTAKQLQEKIDEYFKYCDENNKPYTITGLAVFLDVDREVIFYNENKDEFHNTIKKAKERILLNNEENLTAGKYNVTFGIFSLKNNFGWTEKQDINVNANANLNNSYANLTDEELRKLASKK